MSEVLRYRLVDEPRPSVLQRFALPPLLVFLAAQYFLPWGALLMAANAAALNGPYRNREIGCSLAPIVSYFTGVFLLDLAVRADLLEVNQAHYVFVVAIGIGLLFLAAAFISQQETSELRRYLRRQD